MIFAGALVLMFASAVMTADCLITGREVLAAINATSFVVALITALRT